jgi:hypothetical protein
MTDGIAAQAAWLLHIWHRAETSRQSAPTTVGMSAALPAGFSTWSLLLPRRPRGVPVVMVKTPYLSFLRILPVVQNGDGGARRRRPRSPIYTPEDALVPALDHPWTAKDGYDNRGQTEWHDEDGEDEGDEESAGAARHGGVLQHAQLDHELEGCGASVGGLEGRVKRRRNPCTPTAATRSVDLRPGVWEVLPRFVRPLPCQRRGRSRTTG